MQEQFSHYKIATNNTATDRISTKKKKSDDVGVFMERVISMIYFW